MMEDAEKILAEARRKADLAEIANLPMEEARRRADKIIGEGCVLIVEMLNWTMEHEEEAHNAVHLVSKGLTALQAKYLESNPLILAADPEEFCKMVGHAFMLGLYYGRLKTTEEIIKEGGELDNGESGD